MVVWTIWDNYASLSIITNKEFSQTLSVQMRLHVCDTKKYSYSIALISSKHTYHLMRVCVVSQLLLK